MGRPKTLTVPNKDMPQKTGSYHRSDEEYLEAIRVKFGNITEVALSLGLASPSVVRNRIKGSPLLQEALIEAREQKKDLIEEAFIKKIKEGDRFVIIQAMKSSFMRDRGFGQKIEIEATNTNKNLNVNLDNLTVDELLQYEALVNKTLTSSE